MKTDEVRYSAENLPEDDRAGVRVPAGFTLAGYGRTAPDDRDAGDLLSIDAYGMKLPNGTAITICERGDCDPHIKVWASPEEAAEAHRSFIVYPTEH